MFFFAVRGMERHPIDQVESQLRAAAAAAHAAFGDEAAFGCGCRSRGHRAHPAGIQLRARPPLPLAHTAPLKALVSYRMNGFCINQPFAGMQPLVDAIFNSDIHNNGDLNEELWCPPPPLSPISRLHSSFHLWLQLLCFSRVCKALQRQGHVRLGLRRSTRQARRHHGQRPRSRQQLRSAVVLASYRHCASALVSRSREQERQPGTPSAVRKRVLRRPQRAEGLNKQCRQLKYRYVKT